MQNISPFPFLGLSYVRSVSTPLSVFRNKYQLMRGADTDGRTEGGTGWQQQQQPVSSVV